jgi:hypothetical protein
MDVLTTHRGRTVTLGLHSTIVSGAANSTLQVFPTMLVAIPITVRGVLLHLGLYQDMAITGQVNLAGAIGARGNGRYACPGTPSRWC